MALQRLQQTLAHLSRTNPLSLLQGPNEPALLHWTLGTILDIQTEKFASKTAVVSCAQNIRHSFSSLRERTRQLARGLLALGARHGDCIGVVAWNCAEYVELFFACGRIGVILVVLNTTYTPEELRRAIIASECKFLLAATTIGSRDNGPSIDALLDASGAIDVPGLEQILLLMKDNSKHHHLSSLQDVLSREHEVTLQALREAELAVNPHDVCNLQFTSGTTGNPKAAMLTHYNIINNARFIGERMGITDKDILCCPPPLFHCFGLVLGLLAMVTLGGTIVFPNYTFDADSVLRAVSEEKCTAIHGVPAMWAAELQLLGPQHDVSTLWTGIAAGSATPRQMMEDLGKRMNLKHLTNTYGWSFLSAHETFLTNRPRHDGNLTSKFHDIEPRLTRATTGYGREDLATHICEDNRQRWEDCAPRL
ncbi:hypothetical protein LTS17_001107 [Exophiala oligosperma]